MKLPDDHPVKRLPGPGPQVDPAQVQGELHAYLVQRGRQVARDLGLGQLLDHELYRLGELDCIDQHPTLDPDLATHLEMIADQRDRPRPRVTLAQGNGQDQGHAQDQAQGLRPTPANRQARASRDGRQPAQPHGQVDHAGRGRRETADRNVLFEQNDPDEEKWT
jgi:hypothetical protein